VFQKTYFLSILCTLCTLVHSRAQNVFFVFNAVCTFCHRSWHNEHTVDPVYTLCAPPVRPLTVLCLSMAPLVDEIQHILLLDSQSGIYHMIQTPMQASFPKELAIVRTNLEAEVSSFISIRGSWSSVLTIPAILADKQTRVGGSHLLSGGAMRRNVGWEWLEHLLAQACTRQPRYSVHNSQFCS
jgi:hypothetical protein